jgi:hypothetical protein
MRLLADKIWEELKNIYSYIPGGPDFFIQGPFSVILNALGAASSFQTWDRYLGGVRGILNYFENFSADLWKSQEVPKMFFKNVVF